MFLGEYEHNIDAKGRLTIPAKFRGELAAGLVVTRGFDRNLMIFTLDEWHSLAGKIAERPLGDDSVRAFRRRVFSGAADLSPDRQGRIIVPEYLREFAGIEREVIVAGMFNYVEIWSAAAWQNVRASAEESNDATRWEALGV